MSPDREKARLANSMPLGPNIKFSASMLGTERIPKTGWRRGWDSNPRDPFGPNGFQDRRSQPLSYPSVYSEASPIVTYSAVADNQWAAMYVAMFIEACARAAGSRASTSVRFLRSFTLQE